VGGRLPFGHAHARCHQPLDHARGGGAVEQAAAARDHRALDPLVDASAGQAGRQAGEIRERGAGTHQHAVQRRAHELPRRPRRRDLLDRGHQRLERREVEVDARPRAARVGREAPPVLVAPQRRELRAGRVVRREERRHARLRQQPGRAGTLRHRQRRHAGPVELEHVHRPARVAQSCQQREREIRPAHPGRG